MTVVTQLRPVAEFTTRLALAGGAGVTPLGNLNTVLAGVGTVHVSLINTGLQGPPGPPGPGATFYDHDQSSPAAEWVVNHNLGRLVSVTVLSPGGVEVEAEIVQVSINQTRVFFNQPQTGKTLVR